MLSSLRVSVSLAEAKVNHIADILTLIETHQEIVRLHISMQKVVLVQKLHSCNHLVG